MTDTANTSTSVIVDELRLAADHFDRAFAALTIAESEAAAIGDTLITADELELGLEPEQMAANLRALAGQLERDAAVAAEAAAAVTGYTVNPYRETRQ